MNFLPLQELTAHSLVTVLACKELLTACFKGQATAETPAALASEQLRLALATGSKRKALIDLSSCRAPSRSC